MLLDQSESPVLKASSPPLFPLLFLFFFFCSLGLFSGRCCWAMVVPNTTDSGYSCRTMKEQKQAKKFHECLKMEGSKFWQYHMRRALTNRKRMSALRKITRTFENRVDVHFKKASSVGTECDIIHVSAMNETLVQQAVMILQQEKSAIEKLRCFVKCEKKFRGAVIGKGGKGVRDITTTAGSGTRIQCDDSKGGFFVTSFETQALGIAHVNLERRIKDCSMLANKRRPRQDKDAQRICGSPVFFAKNPQKKPPSAHQQQKQKLQAGTIADSSGQPWTIVRSKKPPAAKPRPKTRFKRDGLCPLPNVGDLVPIRTTPHSATATGKRKTGSSSRARTANSNEIPIAKGIANQTTVSPSANKGAAPAKARPGRLSPAADATAQSVRQIDTVKAVAEFCSKEGVGRTSRGVASASQADEVARVNRVMG